MKTVVMTAVIVVETTIIALLIYGVHTLNDQLKETQSALTEAQASYERCVDKNERFQSLYQTVVNEYSRLRIKVVRYESKFGVMTNNIEDMN